MNQDDFRFNDSAITGYGYDEAFRNDRAAGLWWPRRPWLKRFYRVKNAAGRLSSAVERFGIEPFDILNGRIVRIR